MDRIYCSKPLELRQRAGGKRVLTGYAAVYHREGDASTEFEMSPGTIERIAPGAFDQTLETNKDVVALANHNSDAPLGRQAAGTLRLEIDDIGLRYEVDLPDTSIGRDMAESVSRGDINGSSFGFSIPRGGSKIERHSDVTVRTLTAINLVEVSPVTFPAYSGTSSNIRSSEGCDEVLRELRAEERRQRWEQIAKDLSDDEKLPEETTSPASV